jgi:phosphate-selective porin OprO/OprP
MAARLGLRGRTQIDFSSYDVPNNVNSDPSLVNPIRNGVDFRRARLGVEFTMYDQFEWILEYDFVNSVLAMPSAAGPAAVVAVPAPTDLFVTWMKLPVVGNFRVGNQKEPIGMEHLTSSRFLGFIERSFNQDAFYGGFNNGFTPGLMFFNTAFDERTTWAAGVFKPTTNVFAFDQSDGDWSVTGRVSALPWYVDEGNGLLHVGAAARQAGVDNGVWRYRTRGPERSGLSQNWWLFADTGKITAVNQQWYNFEAAMQLGSCTVVAEYLVDFLHDAARGNAKTVGTTLYQGGYVEVLYFLTGEKRDYNRKSGVFDRVIPAENVFLVDTEEGAKYGTGAWQIGTRFNYLDLNDKGINGGRLKDVTIGLNWFLNPNMKVQWNYSITDRQSITPGDSGTIQGFGMRLAHDF